MSKSHLDQPWLFWQKLMLTSMGRPLKSEAYYEFWEAISSGYYREALNLKAAS